MSTLEMGEFHGERRECRAGTRVCFYAEGTRAHTPLAEIKKSVCATAISYLGGI